MRINPEALVFSSALALSALIGCNDKQASYSTPTSETESLEDEKRANGLKLMQLNYTVVPGGFSLGGRMWTYRSLLFDPRLTDRNLVINPPELTRLYEECRLDTDPRAFKIFVADHYGVSNQDGIVEEKYMDLIHERGFSNLVVNLELVKLRSSENFANDYSVPPESLQYAKRNLGLVDLNVAIRSGLCKGQPNASSEIYKRELVNGERSPFLVLNAAISTQS